MSNLTKISYNIFEIFDARMILYNRPIILDYYAQKMLSVETLQ